MRLAVVVSHPIQYYAPIFRALSQKCELRVFYTQQISPQQQSSAGFGVAFEWDVDLLSGYNHTFLRNVSKNPGPSHFCGSDTPEIGSRLREGRLDALLVLGWYLKSFVQAIWAAKRMGLPVMVRGDSQLTTPRSRIKNLAKQFCFPRFLRLFDAALYVGHHSRGYYRHYGYPEERLFFSPHCVDNDWFASRATSEARECFRRELGIAADVKVLLFAGKLVPFKRPGDVIAAAAKCRLGGARVEVMVAGSGELERELRRDADGLCVPTYFLGFCNQTRMPEAYAAADILVLPSTGRETWGLVANEALACGKPVVVSDACGCAPDLAEDGIAGRVVPLADIEGLGGAITDLMCRPPSSQALSRKAANYSVELATRGILQAGEFVAPVSGR